MLVLKEGKTGFAMLEAVAAANATNAAEAIQWWHASDTAMIFRNSIQRDLANYLGVNNQFAAENSPWTNGTVETVMNGIK